MKNKSFGDINDYKKYGILRILSDSGKIRTGVCWMLTEDNNENDGKFTSYLEKPTKWRKYDPLLFDALHYSLNTVNTRNVEAAEELKLIDNTYYFTKVLQHKNPEREEYFNDFDTNAANCDLIFFDPDNGIEVNSCPSGRKNSPKYLYWEEIIKCYEAGHSLLIYQHFPRIERKLFISQISENIKAKLDVDTVINFQTSNVLFIFIPQTNMKEYYLENSRKVEHTWKDEIKLSTV